METLTENLAALPDEIGPCVMTCKYPAGRGDSKIETLLEITICNKTELGSLLGIELEMHSPPLMCLFP